MSLSIASLLGELEGSAGRLSRQVVDNATLPLKQAASEFITGVAKPAAHFGTGLIVKLALSIAGLVLALTAIGFGTAALYTYLAQLEGRPMALLIVGGGFAVLAAVSIAAMLSVSLLPTAPVTPQPVLEAAAPIRSDAMQPPVPPPEPAASASLLMQDVLAPSDLDTIEALGAALGAAGLEREQAGLQAGLALARRLTPLQLVLIGAAAGFFAGQRMRQTP